MCSRKDVVLSLSILFLIFIVAMGSNYIKPKALTIKPVETVTEDLTLLERMNVDVDNDTEDESIELYTSATRGQDGVVEWDDGQQWLLLVRDGEKAFPLFDGYVQLGQLEFWVVSINKSRITSPAEVDLDKHIYVMNTGNSMELSDYYWDQQNFCFKQEVVFDPPNQWGIRSSNKYNNFDPALIEPMP